MGDNTNSPFSSHQSAKLTVWGNFPNEEACLENINIVSSFTSLIAQLRLEKCCWSEIEYIRNPINYLGAG